MRESVLGDRFTSLDLTELEVLGLYSHIILLFPMQELQTIEYIHLTRSILM